MTEQGEMVQKTPMALQTVIGFVLITFGAVMMICASLWANGDLRFIVVFLGLGVLYLVNGVPPAIEGAMTMANRDKDAKAKKELKNQEQKKPGAGKPDDTT